MQICMILQDEMHPVPDTVKIVQDFGSERVVSDTGAILARGNAVLVEGAPTDIAAWLAPFPCVYQSNNPMLGLWRPMHVKLEFRLEVSHNLGASYREEYRTSDLEDPELTRRIAECRKKCLRYVLVDQFDAYHQVCPQHQAIIDTLEVRRDV